LLKRLRFWAPNVATICLTELYSVPTPGIRWISRSPMLRKYFPEDVVREVAEQGDEQDDDPGRHQVPEERQALQRLGQVAFVEGAKCAADHVDDGSEGPDRHDQRCHHQGAGNEGVPECDQA
jgi:hypothetical protein